MCVCSKRLNWLTIKISEASMFFFCRRWFSINVYFFRFFFQCLYHSTQKPMTWSVITLVSVSVFRDFFFRSYSLLLLLLLFLSLLLRLFSLLLLLRFLHHFSLWLHTPSSVESKVDKIFIKRISLSNSISLSYRCCIFMQTFLS